MTARRRKTTRARTAQARRLYRRLEGRLSAQYQEVVATLGADDLRGHLACAVAYSRTLARIARVEQSSGVAWTWEKGFVAPTRKKKKA